MTITKTVNRRQLVKGAVWSAPVVMASATIPAYAASKRDYVVTYSLGAQYSYYNGYGNQVNFGSDILRDLPFPNGLGVRYESGMGTVVDVTINRMKAVYALPKGWVTGIRLTSGSYSQPVKVSGAKYGISDYNYDTFEFTFAAPAKGKTQPSNVRERQPILGTTFTAVATSFGYATNAATVPAYMGYVGSFTTADGVSKDFNTIINRPLVRI